MADVNERAIQLHKENKGKIEVISKVSLSTADDLSLAYTPGVAEPCRQIHQNIEKVYEYTSKGNMVAVVTDGSAVLGLGNIGPEAALPVMEGKAILFKGFAGVDAYPICLDTQNPDEIIQAARLLAPGFGGINLEDISAPRCFYIEEKLKEILNIPVFHDDQHGTAIVVLAGLLNAVKVTGKNLQDMRAVINGAGAAGIAIAKLLQQEGIGDIILCDIDGIIEEQDENLNPYQRGMAAVSNKQGVKGKLADALINSDVFVGVSVANIVSKDMVASMKKDPIIFAMANPVPEIMPEDAIAAGAKVVGTGRSDFPNQINNVLAFPGIFRGALDARVRKITDEMKSAAAKAIASIVTDQEISEGIVIPSPFNKKVAIAVAEAVKDVASNKNK